MINRIKSPKYLLWIRTQPCCCESAECAGDVVPAHTTIKCPESVKGMGQKDHDVWAVPLCQRHHALEHQAGVKTFWGDENRERIIVQHLTRYLSENSL